MYYVYMLRCEGNTLYTGYTPDLVRRLGLHRSGKGAKYTRAHKPISLAMAWRCENEIDAMRLEYAIKKNLKRTQKDALLHAPHGVVSLFPQLSGPYCPLSAYELTLLWKENDL